MNKLLKSVLTFVSQITIILIWSGLSCWALVFAWKQFTKAKKEITHGIEDWYNQPKQKAFSVTIDRRVD